MADRKVRAIFEAKVDGAKKAITGFGKDVADAGKKVDGLVDDLKALDGTKVDLDVEIDAAKKKLSDLTGELADLKAQPYSIETEFKIEQTKAAIGDVRKLIKDLTSEKAEVKVDVAIKDAQKRISDLTAELGELRTMDASPEVDVRIKDTQKKLREAKTELRELNGAKAEMTVTADVSGAESALSGMKDSAGAAGAEAGEEAGGNIASNIIDSLGTIPIAGAIVGIGAAIGVALFKGIQDGLAIEAGRDLFSARTGLDETTAAKFGRAAGEAYSQAWGESVEANMETARVAMEQGLIDADATEREVERVIASLSGVSEIMQEDIPAAARAAGQMIKTGMVDNSEEAFDVLVAGYQKGANASADFLDTMEEYPTHFRDLGLSAGEATGLLIQGLEGGAFNADKVADSLKELTIRVKENAEESSAALGELGLSGSEMADAFSAGGKDARDALDQILTKLGEVKDPTDRARLAVALFGTQAEDMASALGNLDLSTAVDELGGLEEVAGASGRALKTMSDNAATDIEEAKRSIETAMDGIKGALAAAFSDDISAAADWVSKNRAPLMQFFLDVINGAIDAGIAFSEFGAGMLDTVADIADAISEMPGYLIGEDMKVAMQEVSDSSRDAADRLRTDVPSALEDVRDKVDTWAAPELLKAKVHDATMVMSEDMDDFSAKVDASGGTVTINGDKVNAEEALDILVENIDGETGTVTINGHKVPAEKALDTLMRTVNISSGDVTVGADTSKGRSGLLNLISATNRSSGTIGIGANAANGQATLGAFVGRANRSRATVGINANTSSADWALSAWLGRPRSMTIGVRVAGVNGSQGGLARHEGGYVQRGLNDGGWVPGTDPGYDNVLWPLNSGGRTLQQPLAGGEFVVNSSQSAIWGPVLEWMNAGGKPGAASSSMAGLELSGTLDTPWGPAQVRGIVQDELTSQARQARIQGAR